MKISFNVNGDTQLILTSENDRDAKMLDVAFKGMKVKDVRMAAKEDQQPSVTITMEIEPK